MAERKPFLLRMDPELWAELEAWAKDELRSVNGQIEYVLKQAVLKRKGKEIRNPKSESPGGPPQESEVRTPKSTDDADARR